MSRQRLEPETTPPGVLIREAQGGDLPAILELYATSTLSSAPEALGRQVQAGHTQAFAAIAQDPNNGIYVAQWGDRVVGTFQLTFIRQLSYGGCWVAQVESVFVHPDARSHRVGTAMMRWAIAEAERRGALRLQLTSNLRRARAHRFYERLGFEASHAGMKLYLPARAKRSEPRFSVGKRSR